MATDRLEEFPHPGRPLTEAEAEAIATCPNCGCVRASEFCPDCGQRDQPLRASAWYFVRGAINEYFGLDGRLWLTLGIFLFKPGELTAENIRGRRARYLAPLRIYLTASVVFFALVSLLDPGRSVERLITKGEVADSMALVSSRLASLELNAAAINQQIVDSEKELARAIRQRDSLRSAFLADSLDGVPVDSLTEAWARRLTQSKSRALALESRLKARIDARELRLRRLDFERSVLDTYPPDSLVRLADLADAVAILHPDPRGLLGDGFEISVGSVANSSSLQRLKSARTNRERGQALSDFVRSALSRLPVAFFLLLPVFALIMKVFYLRHDWYYSEHLIFSLHNHAFLFVVSIVVLALATLGDNPRWAQVTSLALMAWLVVYFLLAMKRVYGQGWPKTILKWLLILIVYGGNVFFIVLLLPLILAATLG